MVSTMDQKDPAIAQAAGIDLKQRFHTIHETFCNAATENADSLALICLHQPYDLLPIAGQSYSAGEKKYLRWTYSDLQQRSNRLANALTARGIKKGTPIAAMLSNRAETVVCFWTAMTMGCPWVPINLKTVADSKQVQHLLNLAQVEVLIVEDEKLAAGMEKAAPREVGVMATKILASKLDPSFDVEGWTCLPDLIFQADGSKTFHSEVKPDDLALIIFTSGTTSLPKGCPWSNKRLTAALMVIKMFSELTPASHSCDILPLHAMYGVMFSTGFWGAGGTVTFASSFFDPKATLRAIEAEKCNTLPSVPSMIHLLVEELESEHRDTSSLDQMIVSGSYVSPSDILLCKEKLRATKTACVFGMSEFTTLLGEYYSQVPTEVREKIPAGIPSPGAIAKICLPNSRTPVKRGEYGELHGSGANLISGYIGMESDSFYEEEGRQWFVTGDQAMMDDDGFVYVTGRYKDVIIRAGQNISPAAVESVLDTHPAVVSQVVAAPDELAGEIPVAVIELHEGQEMPAADDLYDQVRDNLGHIYVPEHLFTLADLGLKDWPKTSSGKIRKVELREIVQEHLDKPQKGASSRSRGRSRSSSSRGAAADSTTQEALIQMWSRLTKVPTSRMSGSTDVHDFADSITITRFRDQVKKDFGAPITFQEMAEHGTIEAQAKIISGRRGREFPKDEGARPVRQGGPGIDAVVSANDEPEVYEHIQAEANGLLKAYGLTWDEDVEDVLPVWDVGRMDLDALRPRSWTFRFSYVAAHASSEQLQRALETTLSSHPMLRTLAMPQDGVTCANHIIIRASKHWFEHTIRNEPEVETPEDLWTAYLDDEWFFVTAPRPMFRARIMNVKSTNTAGLIFYGNHSTFDAVSMGMFIEDLDTVLSGKGAPSRPHYSLFAETYYLHQTSRSAQKSIAFHTRRLKSISAQKKALWPPQRAKGWFKGSTAGWAEGGKRIPLDDPQNLHGFNGISKQRRFPNLKRLRTSLDVSNPTIFKTAFALATIQLTGEEYAIFCNLDAGRSWPFLENRVAENLPSLFQMNGPTYEISINFLHIPHMEKVGDLLRRVQDEQGDLTRHAHAPVSTIQSQLLPEDSDMLRDVMRRQLFNWLPGPEAATSSITKVASQPYDDLGISVNALMLDPETLSLHAMYDDAQLRASEVEDLLERVLDVAEWITDQVDEGGAVGNIPSRSAASS